jgi:DNA repair exonuclease SbcCD ATPase subunit
MSETAAPSKPSRLISLTAENFKRLRAVEIKFGKRKTEIVGGNEQGKTSVMDAIAVALGGTKYAPELPIRKGAKSAEIIVKTDELTITRRFTESGGSTITIVGADGARLNSPQTVLDRLVGGGLMFDPLAFARMKPAEQVSAIKTIAGLGEVFAKLDAERKRVSEERVIVGREVDRQRGAVQLMPIVESPDQPVSVMSLITQVESARDTIAENALERSQLAVARTELDSLAKQRDEIEQRITRGTTWVRENADRIMALVDPDTASIQTQIGQAEETNKKVEQKKRRADAVTALETAERTYKTHTRRIDAIDEEKAAALSKAQLPIPDLSFSDSELLLKGVPFADIGMSAQIKASVAIGLAQNPQLRVMLVRDASLLDDEGMKVLSELAEKHDAQVLVELVHGNKGEVGVEIVDGEVASVTE